MPEALKWDEVGKKLYEVGVEKGVLYVQRDDGSYDKGIAWNGLISVSEKPEGGEPTKLHANNRKYLELLSAEEFKASLTAYTYPDEFMECDGSKMVAEGIYLSQQTRKKFALVYETRVGSDTDEDHSRKLHIVWNAQAQPSERSYKTINDSPEAIEFSWELTTTPVEIKKDGFKPASHMVIDLKKVTKDKYKKITDKLWGSENSDSAMLTPDEVIRLIEG